MMFNNIYESLANNKIAKTLQKKKMRFKIIIAIYFFHQFNIKNKEKKITSSKSLL